MKKLLPFVALLLLLVSCGEDAVEPTEELTYFDIDLKVGVSKYLTSDQIQELGADEVAAVDKLLTGGIELKSSVATIEIPDGSIDAIQDAVNDAQAGDIIVIKAGTHQESSSIIVNKAVTIMGEPSSEIIFDLGPAESVGIIEPAIYIVGTDQVVISGVQMSAASTLGGGGIMIEESHRTVLMGNTLTNFQFGVLVEDGDRTRILRNTIASSTEWQNGLTQNVNGITIVDGNQSLIVGNQLTGAVFGAFLSDHRGFFFGNDMSGNLYGSIFCNVPANALPLPSGKFVGSERPAERWFGLFNRSTSNLSTGILVIDGARDNYLSNNTFGSNGAYDIELAGTSERFGFTTPPSVDNRVRLGDDDIVKDCGDDNRVDGGQLVDVSADPCS